MSSISSRPTVHRIVGPVLTTVAVSGVVLAAKAVKALLGAAAEGMKRASQLQNFPAEQGLQSIVALQRDFQHGRQKAFEQLKGDLPALDASRVASLTAISNTPFFIDNCAALEPQCRALQTAATPGELQKAEQALIGSLANAHHRIFVNTLALACQRAAARLGFDRVEVVRLPAEVRVIAADASGRTLVSEVKTDMRREPSVATEVVGVMDDSCRKLLDDFDRALEEEGVRSAPPHRRYTGGVCELAAARELARNRWKALAKPTAAGQPKRQAATARAQQLNPAQTVTARSKG